MEIFRKNEMLKVSKVADRWGVSRQHIYNLIDRGFLRAFRFGASRGWFVPLADVKAFEESSAVDPAA